MPRSTCRRPPPVRRSPSPTSSSAPSPPSGAPTATGWPSCSSSAKPRSARPSPSPRPSPTTVPRSPTTTSSDGSDRTTAPRRRPSAPLATSVRPLAELSLHAPLRRCPYDVSAAAKIPGISQRCARPFSTTSLRPRRRAHPATVVLLHVYDPAEQPFGCQRGRRRAFMRRQFAHGLRRQFCRQVRCSGVVLNMCWIITLGVPSQGVPHIRNYHSTRGGIAVVERSSPAVRNLFPTSDHLLEISRGGCSCGIGLPESSDVSKNQKRLLRRYRNADWSQPKIARALEASKRAKGRLNHGAVSTEPVRALKDLVRILVGAVGQVRFFAYDNTLATPLRGEGSPTSLSNFNALQRFPCYLLLDIHRD